MKYISIPAIKKGEHSCRNCQKFTHKYSCWIYINDNGENCKMFKEKIEAIQGEPYFKPLPTDIETCLNENFLDVLNDEIQGEQV